MEKIAFAFESFKNTQDLIKFIDQKTGGILVITSFIISIFTAISSNFNFADENSLWSDVTFILGTVIGILLLIVIYLSLFCILRPRLAMNYSPENCSLLYFEHVAQQSDKELQMHFHDLTDDKMLKDILNQTSEVSKILEAKTKYLAYAINILGVTIIILTLFVIVSTTAG